MWEPRSRNTNSELWTSERVMAETRISIRVRNTEDSRGFVHGDTSNISPYELDLSDVDTGTDAQAFAESGPPDRRRATQCSCWCVERREQAIAGRVDLAAVVSLERRPCRLVVRR